MSDLVKIGALWVGQDKNGNQIYTGKMGDARLVIFPNNFKDSDKHPDYIAYVATPQKKEDGEQSPEGTPF